MTDSRVVK